MDDSRSTGGLTTQIIAGVIVFLLTGVLILLWRWNRNRRDCNKIYEFMCSPTGIEYNFRSKERIASETNIPPERVIVLCARLCAKGKLRRNQKEKDSWMLS